MMRERLFVWLMPKLQNAREQWKESTLLRLCSYTCVVLVLVWSVLVLEDEKAARQQDYNAKQKQLNKIMAIGQQTQWLERLPKIEVTHKEFKSTLWVAETKGMAEAAFQSWLDKELKSSGLHVQRFETSSSVSSLELGEGPTDIEKKVPLNGWRISARVEGNFEAEPFYILLNAIESHKRRIKIDQLDVTQTTRSRYVMHLVVEFIRRGAA